MCVSGLQVGLQEKLLHNDNHSLKPDEEFLQSFADVVGSTWPSLVTCLSLSGSAIEEMREEGSSEQHHVLALKMLRKWALREDATYGQLYQTLTAPSLFQFSD